MEKVKLFSRKKVILESEEEIADYMTIVRKEGLILKGITVVIILSIFVYFFGFKGLLAFLPMTLALGVVLFAMFGFGAIKKSTNSKEMKLSLKDLDEIADKY